MWGGSTSVGTAAIQLAVAAGVKVITVAGNHNIYHVQDLGAAKVFDYRSPTVAKDILHALEATEFMGICDCIGTTESVLAWLPIYRKLGGRYGSVLPPPPEMAIDIEGANVLGPDIALNHVHIGKAVWSGFIPAALEKGSFRPALKPSVFSGGLAKVQDAVSAVKHGLSFEKAVIQL